jgi:hypothetical protein
VRCLDGWCRPADIKASGPDDSCCLCWEELAGGGCIVLQCGHLVHLMCAKDRLKVRALPRDADRQVQGGR